MIRIVLLLVMVLTPLVLNQPFLFHRRQTTSSTTASQSRRPFHITRKSSHGTRGRLDNGTGKQLLTTITTTTATTTPPSPGGLMISSGNYTELEKFIIKLNDDYYDAVKDGYLSSSLDGIYSRVKLAWAEMLKAGQKHSSREIWGLQRILRDIAVDYNLFFLSKVFKDPEDAWERYKKAFGKEYLETELKMRKEIFMKNKKDMEKQFDLFNNGRVSHITMLNYLSDHTSEELKKMKNFQPPNKSQRVHPKRLLKFNDTRYYRYAKGSQIPASVDWREKGYVTDVNFQGNCSCSYAFAGIGLLEAYHKKKTGNLIDLSVQNILDCTWDFGNNGCNGGSIHSVLEFVYEIGVATYDDYPYTKIASHNCQWKEEQVVAYFDDRLYTVEGADETTLQHAVANYGPAVVGIGTAGGFDFYASGVFQPRNCGPADHSALIVGYGTDLKYGDYWIIKNSYGEFWGENGYIRMARNKNNICHVASHAFFPVKY